MENFLPACAACNSYRWDYSPEELQWILIIGVWARKQMEEQGEFGTEMSERFFSKEVRKRLRRIGSD